MIYSRMKVGDFLYSFDVLRNRVVELKEGNKTIYKGSRIDILSQTNKYENRIISKWFVSEITQNIVISLELEGA